MNGRFAVNTKTEHPTLISILFTSTQQNNSERNLQTLWKLFEHQKTTAGGPVQIQSLSSKRTSGGLRPPSWEAVCEGVAVFWNYISQGGPVSFLWSVLLLVSFCLSIIRSVCLLWSVLILAWGQPSSTHTQAEDFGIELKQNHSGPALGNTAKMNWPLWRLSEHTHAQTRTNIEE